METLKINDTSKVKPAWQHDIAPYRRSSLLRSLWQLADSGVPLVLAWALMFYALSYSYWLTLALAPLAAGFQVRVFIIFHDCGHGSFFKSRKANDIVGSVCGIVCFTPYYYWRHYHALHHSTTGNLGQRVEGQLQPMRLKRYVQTNGDFLTLTVKEYRQLKSWEKLTYRLYRNPLFLFLLIPLFLFLVLNRFSNPKAALKERLSVLFTDIALLGIILLLGFSVGIIPLVVVFLPTLFFSSMAGVWLFYVQHQFEQTYWADEGEWDFVRASLKGSSYYKLPIVLQWFTGNIGLHHIHHLSPRIPNYFLHECHQNSLLFQETPSITLKLGLKSLFLHLWDEDRQIMVGFKSNRLGRIGS